MEKKKKASKDPPLDSLGQEDPLDKKMATHSSMLAWGST